MEATDVIDVLKACAAYDQRTTGDADVIAWTVALPEQITKAAAMEAVVAHYQESPMPMRVADLIRIVRATRRCRTAAAGQPDFPPGLTFTQEQRYRRAWFAMIGDGVEPEAATAAVDARFKITRPEMKPRPVRALVQGAWAP